MLLVCFNQLLGDTLAAEFARSERVTAGTFHQVARRLAVQANRLIPEEPTQDWWDRELPMLFPELAAEVGFEVDAIVVDEGQDFRPEWWDSLRLVMRSLEDGWFYVFADTHQALFVPGWSTPFAAGTFEYRLTRNCRNTRPIADRVAAVFGGDIRTNKVEGPKPKFHVVTSIASAVQKVLALLGQLMAEGLEPTQIQVLATSNDVVGRLRGRDVDGVALVARGDDGIGVETVQRFKGLEADAVVVVLPEVATELDQSLAYTAMSRAVTT